MRMFTKISWSALVLATCAMGVRADEITVGDKTYRDVYVRESSALYYIQTPEDGKIVTVTRDEVVAGSVKITEDGAARAALLARWKSNNPREIHKERIRDKMADAASSEAMGESTAPTLQLQGDRAAADRHRMRVKGYVPYIKLTDVPLGQALDAILRPMGLDYQIVGDMIYVSTPELLRREAPGTMVTRHYTYSGNETMHKIILGNPRAVFQGQTGGLGNVFGGQAGFGSQGSFGGQGGFGGGGAGALGGGGGGAFGGGGGGAFGGQGGFGGGGGGGDVTGTSNISQLFSNIDDRMVGEAPAQVGGYYFQD